MAISIDSSPASIYNFAYRNLVYTVSSNDATVVRCLADIYIDDVYKTTLEKSPDFGLKSRVRICVFGESI